MTDISNKVAANSFFIYFGRVANLTITFFVFIHLANYMGEESFGRLSLAIAYVGVFDIVANFGLNQILVREIATGRLGSPSLLGTGILAKVALTITSVVLACATAILFSYPKETLAAIWIISLNLLISSKLSSTRTIFESIFQAKLQMVYPVMYNLLDGVLFAGLVYFSTYKYHIGLTGIALIYTLCNLPGAVLLLIRFLKSAQISFSGSLREAKHLLIEASPLAAYLLFSILSTKMDVLLLSWMKSESEVGFYSAATRLVYPLTFLSTSFSISLFPILSQYFVENRPRFVQTLRTGFKYISLLGVLVSISFAFNSSKIISTLYIPSYAPCIPSFAVLILALSLTFLNFFFLDIFIAARQQKAATVITAVAFIINIGVNLFFIPRFSILGASYARLISGVVGVLMFVWLTKSRLKVAEIIPFGKLLPMILLMAAMQLVLKPLSLSLSLASSLACFIFLIWILKVLNQEEKDYILNLLKIRRLSKTFVPTSNGANK